MPCCTMPCYTLTMLTEFSSLAMIVLQIPHELTALDMEDLASAMHGYVGADISAVCVEAGLVAANTAEEGIIPH